jgi:hypothetical protein
MLYGTRQCHLEVIVEHFRSEPILMTGAFGVGQVTGNRLSSQCKMLCGTRPFHLEEFLRHFLSGARLLVAQWIRTAYAILRENDCIGLFQFPSARRYTLCIVPIKHVACGIAYVY